MILHALIKILVTSVAVLLAAKVVPGIRVKSYGSAIVFAVVLGVLNLTLKPILAFFGFPFILVTLGLFLLVINAFLFWLADKLVEGVECDGFVSCLLGSIFTSVVGMAIAIVLGLH